MSAHAKLSPSSAERWMRCPGSVALCDGLPDTSSSFADEGTAAHLLASTALEAGNDAAHYKGYGIVFAKFDGDDRSQCMWEDFAQPPMVITSRYEVNAEMALAVQDYLDYVRGVQAATGATLMVEQRLSIESITGEPDAHGTSDVVLLAPRELIIIDLKYGRGVAVEADENPQLQIYALAAYNEFSLAQDFDTVRMVIHQPRLGAVSEWVQTVDELLAFGGEVADAAALTAQPDAMLNPTTKGCKFCKAKATCPALRAEVMEMFENVKPATANADLLAEAMSKADLIEGWVKAVRAETESKLLAGVGIPGWKLVQGKRGNRAWSSKEQAEEALKAMRVKHDQMYDYSVISPTTAEKLAKAEVIGPRQWPKLQALITQADGKPSVAPESDKRPALVMSAVAEDFDDMTATTPADACDLL